MVRIAICDDMLDELPVIAAYTYEYFESIQLGAEVSRFTHPDALLTACETEMFHVYILDIVMPMINGIELGREIRRFDREAQIIYVTTEPQYALQAYAANPINYLVKPVEKQTLFDTLTFAVSKVHIDEEQTFTVKTADSLRVIKLMDIDCCEYCSHAVVFSLKNGEEVLSRTIRESFSEYCEAISKDSHFLQCHSSFMVNVRRVERFAKDSFTLFGGKTVPIAAKQYSSVRDAYMDYLMAKGD